MKKSKLIQALGAVVIGFVAGAVDYVYAEEQASSEEFIYVTCKNGHCYDDKTGEYVFESDVDGRFLAWVVDDEAELVEEGEDHASH